MRRSLVVYLLALAVGCAGAVVAGRVVATHLDERSTSAATVTPTTVTFHPPPGQALVSGTIDAFAADGVQTAPISSPFTISALTRGVGKATIENALVNGKRTIISWSGGTPLPITGTGGGLDLAGARIDVNSAGVVWSPAGAARPFVPGKYRVGASVAIGDSEATLGEPRDAVSFEADNRTILTTTEGVVIKVDLGHLSLQGPGRVAVTGRLKVVESNGERTAAKVEMSGGAYEVTIDPGGPDGPGITATIQGPYQAT